MKPIAQRFWSKVTKTEGCWLWIGAKNTRGYGKLSKGRAGEGFIAAHRLSYELAYGPIPLGRNVLHKCDNACCVRPEHLFIGTQADNLADMTIKGHRRYRSHSGEDNGRAKFTLIGVRDVRRRFGEGELRSALAKGYGVNWSTVDRIVKGRLWK